MDITSATLVCNVTLSRDKIKHTLHFLVMKYGLPYEVIMVLEQLDLQTAVNKKEIIYNINVYQLIFH